MSPSARAWAGTLLRFTIAFTDVDGNSGDPTTITFAYQVNGGGATVLAYGASAIVRDGLGAYHVDVDTTNQPGYWEWEWKGAGAAGPQIVKQGVVQVGASIV